jgi:hypothetical protein
MGLADIIKVGRRGGRRERREREKKIAEGKVTPFLCQRLQQFLGYTGRKQVLRRVRWH